MVSVVELLLLVTCYHAKFCESWNVVEHDFIPITSIAMLLNAPYLHLGHDYLTVLCLPLNIDIAHVCRRRSKTAPLKVLWAYLVRSLILLLRALIIQGRVFVFTSDTIDDGFRICTDAMRTLPSDNTIFEIQKPLLLQLLKWIAQLFISVADHLEI